MTGIYRAVITPHPPIRRRSGSPVDKRLLESPGPSSPAG
jgi:hypothetical protein